MNYRRAFIPGGSYFFTLTLQNRESNLLIAKINKLRIAFQQVIKAYPFTIDAIVVLPEHLHMVITLPTDDTRYSQRINFIKGAFSRQLESRESINTSRKIKRERGIWQRRFWEHVIRDEKDFNNHIDYIHYNPVKHGHVQLPSQWEYSSIHRCIHSKILLSDLACSDELIDQQFGESDCWAKAQPTLFKSSVDISKM